MQESAFWKSERCGLNFGGKTPKNWNVGAWIGLSSPDDKKFKQLVLENYLADHDEIFTRSPHHECALVPWLPNKSKMAAADIFNLGKMSITADWIKILHQILWEDAPQPCGDDHVTKSRNRTLICVTSSNERLKDKCVDLSDYNRYLNQIWYRTQILYYQHAGMAKFT